MDDSTSTEKCGNTLWEFPKNFPQPPCQRPKGHPTWREDGVGCSVYPNVITPVDVEAASRAAVAQKAMERGRKQMDDYDIMYIMDLGALDATTAHFEHEQHAAEFGVPRDQWVHMGRPSSLEVLVKPRAR